MGKDQPNSSQTRLPLGMGEKTPGGVGRRWASLRIDHGTRAGRRDVLAGLPCYACRMPHRPPCWRSCKTTRSVEGYTLKRDGCKPRWMPTKPPRKPRVCARERARHPHPLQTLCRRLRPAPDLFDHDCGNLRLDSVTFRHSPTRHGEAQSPARMVHPRKLACSRSAISGSRSPGFSTTRKAGDG